MSDETSELLDTITITQDGDEREIYMSHGLVTTLARIFPDPQVIPTLPVDADLQHRCLTAALSERKRGGKLVKEIDPDDLDITRADIRRLLTWIMEHVLLFFVEGTQDAIRISEKIKETTAALESSLDGSTS